MMIMMIISQVDSFFSVANDTVPSSRKLATNSRLCTLDASVEAEAAIPPLERQKSYRPSKVMMMMMMVVAVVILKILMMMMMKMMFSVWSQVSIAPSIALSAEGEIEPPNTLVTGEDYSIIIQNFPPKSNVRMQVRSW
jgi:hypothetical protein